MAIGISKRFYDGATAKANITGLTALWWDATTVYDFSKPIGRTNVAATDADGDLELDISDVSSLSENDWGFLVLYKLDTIDHEDSLVFAGRMQISSVTGATKLTSGALSWTRPSSWPALSDVTGGNKFSGLHAVSPKGPNWCAFKFTCSGSTNYTVDWGDSTADSTVASASNAEHSFDYANCSDNDIGKDDAEAVTFTDTNDKVIKAGHNYRDGDIVAFSSITTTTGISTATLYHVVNPTKAVTFTVATNKVNLTAHGYIAGETLEFDRIVTTTNISKNTIYYVINPGTDDFEISTTTGGSAIDLTGSNGSGVLFKNDYFKIADTIGGTAKVLTNDGSGNIYRPKYRFAIVDVTPTTGGGTFTALDMNIRHASAGADAAINYSTGWLDIDLHAASMTTLAIVGSSTLNNQHGILKQFKAASLGAITSWSFMFYRCYSLQSIPLLDTSAGTDFLYMFNGCHSLQSIPLLDTSAGGNFLSMFDGCHSLQSIPLLDTSGATNFSSMFSGCPSLQSIPLLDTSAGTSFSYMFSECNSLQSIPLLDTSAGTNFSGMFNNCYSLQSIPLLDTSAGTDFSYMVYGCHSLQSIPLLDTSAGTNFSDMFNNCHSLQSIPAINAAAVTTGNFSNMFRNCYSLQRGRMEGTRFSITYPTGQLSGAELDAIYTGLATVASGTITVTGNYGTASDTPSIATDKGWTVIA